jgi:hypothetical protein
MPLVVQQPKDITHTPQAADFSGAEERLDDNNYDRLSRTEQVQEPATTQLRQQLQISFILVFCILLRVFYQGY